MKSKYWNPVLKRWDEIEIRRVSLFGREVTLVVDSGCPINEIRFLNTNNLRMAGEEKTMEQAPQANALEVNVKILKELIKELVEEQCQEQADEPSQIKPERRVVIEKCDNGYICRCHEDYEARKIYISKGIANLWPLVREFLTATDEEEEGENEADSA